MTSKGVEAITTAVADRDSDTARKVRSYEREHKEPSQASSTPLTVTQATSGWGGGWCSAAAAAAIPLRAASPRPTPRTFGTPPGVAGAVGSRSRAGAGSSRPEAGARPT